MENLEKMRGNVLLEAHKIVNGERTTQYGTPEDNFKAIAKRWTEYCDRKNVFTKHLISEEDVALMLAHLKMVRIETGIGTHDSFVDLCGYVALAVEVAEQ